MRAEAPARRTASHLHQLSDARADGRVTFLALSYRPVLTTKQQPTRVPIAQACVLRVLGIRQLIVCSLC